MLVKIIEKRKHCYENTPKKSGTGEKNKNLQRILITKTRRMENAKSTPEEQKKKRKCQSLNMRK
jgi:hypothetical protein